MADERSASMLELKTVGVPRGHHDVAILERGMAKPAEGDGVFEISRSAVPYVNAPGVWIFHRAARNLPNPPNENRAVNLKAISLHSERWEQDGLYAHEGISLIQVREMLPGIEEMDLEASGMVAAA